MDTTNVIRQLLGEYEQQREENYREEQRRKREASGVDPEILDLINERMFVFRDSRLPPPIPSPERKPNAVPIRRAISINTVPKQHLTKQKKQIMPRYCRLTIPGRSYWICTI